jgi:type IV secretory pathway TrbD component
MGHSCWTLCPQCRALLSRPEYVVVPIQASVSSSSSTGSSSPVRLHLTPPVLLAGLDRQLALATAAAYASAAVGYMAVQAPYAQSTMRVPLWCSWEFQ